MRLKIGIFASSLSNAIFSAYNFLLSTINGQIFTVDNELNFNEVATFEYLDSDNENNATVWTTVTSNFGTSNILSVAHGDGLWVAGGSAGEMRTSTDAITWTTVTSNFGTTLIRSIVYGNNVWVAGGSAGQMRTSTDAITWTTVTSNFGSTIILSIVYGDGLWFASGDSGQMRTSTDATNWTTLSGTGLATNESIPAILTVLGTLFAINNQGSAVKTVYGFRSFTFLSPGSGSFPNAMGYGDGKIVIFSSSNRLSNNLGSSWTSINMNSSQIFRSVSYHDKLWVAGGNSGTMRTSTNATTWTTVNSNFGTSLIRSIAYGDGIWVAVGYGGNIRVSSKTFSTQNAKIRNLEYSPTNNRYFAVGDNGTFYSSNNAQTWNTVTSPTNKNINSINYNDNIYLLGVDNE
jgi:hypothetical protein